MRSWLVSAEARPVTRTRMALALLVALAADFVQVGLGPLGFTGLDDLLDLVVAGVEIALLGFHPFLLPTFVLEVLPVVEFMPTWTACVLAIILRRLRIPPVREDLTSESASTGPKKTGPVIDI